jgi:hypothetical protein
MDTGECPANSFCPNGTATPLSCGIGSISLIASDEDTDCTCDGNLLFLQKEAIQFHS